MTAGSIMTKLAAMRRSSKKGIRCVPSGRVTVSQMADAETGPRNDAKLARTFRRG